MWASKASVTIPPSIAWAGAGACSTPWPHPRQPCLMCINAPFRPTWQSECAFVQGSEAHSMASHAQKDENRLFFIDALRVAAIVFVIIHHAAQAYGPTGGFWPVHDRAQSDWFTPFYTAN